MTTSPLKVEELTGTALDLAVAMAIGWKLTRVSDVQIERDGDYMLCGESNKRYSRYVFTPTTDWQQCGELLDRFNVTVSKTTDRWMAFCEIEEMDPHLQMGTTPQIAICRAVAAAKHGETVLLPSEIMEPRHETDPDASR